VLSFYGRLYGLHGRALRRRVGELLERFELIPHLKTEYNELSTGLKQRLALAKALLNDPEVLFLDEPTLGLDPDVSIRIRSQIGELRRERGTTIILTTHYMREAEELCDRIAFINGGRILAEGSADELKPRSASVTWSLCAWSPPSPPASPSCRGCCRCRRAASGSSARWTRPRSGCRTS
jgi:ABC-2 type transport system ATP-binding protein